MNLGPIYIRKFNLVRFYLKQQKTIRMRTEA